MTQARGPVTQSPGSSVRAEAGSVGRSMERRRSRTRWSQLRLCTLGAQKPQMWRGGEGGREGGREGGEFSRSYTTGVPLSMAMDTAYPGWCSSSAQRPGAQTWCLTRNPPKPPNIPLRPIFYIVRSSSAPETPGKTTPDSRHQAAAFCGSRPEVRLHRPCQTRVRKNREQVGLCCYEEFADGLAL